MTPILKLSFVLVLSAATSLGCQKERESETPTETPKPVPVEVPVAEVSIASVSMLEDCPDPEPAAEEAKEARGTAHEMKIPAGDMAESESDMDGRYAMPCSQSTIQIAITGQSDRESMLAIKELRLLGPKGETLAIVKTRLPSIWHAEGYRPWNQKIMPKTDVKASYKISVPNWREVEKKLGGSSYGPMFYLEADFEIDGKKVTARSSQIVREQVEMIET